MAAQRPASPDVGRFPGDYPRDKKSMSVSISGLLAEGQSVTGKSSGVRSVSIGRDDPEIKFKWDLRFSLPIHVVDVKE